MPPTCWPGWTRTRSWSSLRFGVTYTGAYEPVEAIAKALDQLQADTGLDIDIHVDGASGGFLAPFCAPDVLFDFRLPRVKSISASGHKFGLAPLGVGWVIWRDRTELPDDLVFHVNYLGGDMPTFQINFSRPAGEIIAQYYNFLRLGFEGYQRVHNASYEVGQYLAAEIVKLGPFELLCDSDPATGIPTVTWRIREGADPGYTLFDLADRLRARGLAGTRLYPHRNGVRHPRAARPGPAGREPGHGLPAPRRLPGRHRLLRQAPGDGLHDEGRIKRLQSTCNDTLRPAPGPRGWLARWLPGYGGGGLAAKGRSWSGPLLTTP